MKKLIGICALALSQAATAAPIALTWTTTASDLTGSIPGVDGEAITTTITVDNGGSSILSQIWSETDFVSYRIDGASGWWISSTDIDLGASSGSFATDGAGNVTSAGTWYGLYFSGGTITQSWTGVVNGGWWNNGNNEVVCKTGSADCVYAFNVDANLEGSSWTAGGVEETPEPESLALFGLALTGLALARKAKR